jgi:DNA topoisomerase-1
LFKLPRVVGEFEGQDMTAALGRFGPYIRHDAKFYSLTKSRTRTPSPPKKPWL